MASQGEQQAEQAAFKAKQKLDTNELKHKKKLEDDADKKIEDELSGSEATLTATVKKHKAKADAAKAKAAQKKAELEDKEEDMQADERHKKHAAAMKNQVGAAVH